MALSSYSLDFLKMIKQLLGYLLRKAKRIAWLKACLKPLQTIHDSFLNYTQIVVDEIKWNGQTIKLEQLLIQEFGAGIYITTNSISNDGLYIGESPDLRSTIGSTVDGALIYDGVGAISQYSFTINVPAVIVFSAAEMLGYVNKYKMFGTTYNIVIV